MTDVIDLEEQIVGDNRVRMIKAAGPGVSAMGRSTIDLECPFCETVTECYRWSLAGSGKRCDCGAILNRIQAFKRINK